MSTDSSSNRISPYVFPEYHSFASATFCNQSACCCNSGSWFSEFLKFLSCDYSEFWRPNSLEYFPFVVHIELSIQGFVFRLLIFNSGFKLLSVLLPYFRLLSFFVIITKNSYDLQAKSNGTSFNEQWKKYPSVLVSTNGARFQEILSDKIRNHPFFHLPCFCFCLKIFFTCIYINYVRMQFVFFITTIILS